MTEENQLEQESQQTVDQEQALDNNSPEAFAEVIRAFQEEIRKDLSSFKSKINKESAKYRVALQDKGILESRAPAQSETRAGPDEWVVDRMRQDLEGAGYADDRLEDTLGVLTKMSAKDARFMLRSLTEARAASPAKGSSVGQAPVETGRGRASSPNRPPTKPTVKDAKSFLNLKPEERQKWLESATQEELDALYRR